MYFQSCVFTCDYSDTREVFHDFHGDIRAVHGVVMCAADSVQGPASVERGEQISAAQVPAVGYQRGVLRAGWLLLHQAQPVLRAWWCVITVV